MRIGRKSAAGFQFAAKVFQLLRAEAPFQIRASVHSGRRVPLKINRVAFEFLAARAEEMVEAHFVERGRRSIRGNVTADVVLHAVRAHHHGQRVPADKALDAALQFLVAGKKGLQAHGNRICIWGICAERQVDAVNRGVRPEPLEDFRGHLRSAGLQDGIQRL